MAIVIKGVFNIFCSVTKFAFKTAFFTTILAGAAIFTNPDRKKLIKNVKSDIKSETQTDSVIGNVFKNTVIDHLPVDSMTKYENYFLFSVAEVGNLQYVGIFGQWFKLPSRN